MTMEKLIVLLKQMSIKERNVFLCKLKKWKYTTSDEFEEKYLLVPQLNIENIYTNIVSINNMMVKEYQKQGIEWLVEQEKKSTNKGGILADEMGLGKTIQTIGVILSNVKSSTLIVVPLTLVDQWIMQIKRLANVEPFLYHPSNKDFNDIERSNCSDADMKMGNNAAITLTTYGMIARKKSVLVDKKWDRVICDEAHHLKNKKSECHIGVSLLRKEIIWLLTGTPIQNKVSDLYALLELLGYERYMLKDKKQLEKILEGTLLKRTKSDVANHLPELQAVKIEKIEVEWNSKCEKDKAHEIHKILERSNHKEHAILRGTDTLVQLLRAKQSCINPNLLPMTREDDYIMISSKIKKVYEIVRTNGFLKPKLIFCQFRKEIDMMYESLIHHVEEENLKVKTFDGRIANENRKELCSSVCDVMILQIQCACEGLNLQHFKEVYFVSPNWNPAIEDQAIARCHRLGQKDAITVYKFYMENFDVDTKSMDWRIHDLQIKKRKDYI